MKAFVTAHGERYLVAGEHHRLGAMLGECARAAGVSPPREIPSILALAFAHASELWSRISGSRAAASVQGVRAVARGIRVSSAKAERELGVTFRPFAHTAADTVNWFRHHDLLRTDGPSSTGAAPGAPHD